MRLLALIIVSIGALSVAEAACGGGGWKQPAVKQIETAPPAVAMAGKKDIPAEQTSVAATLDAQESADFAALNLTPSQQRRAAEISHDIKTQYAQLEKDVAHAKSQLANCHGDCSVETVRYKTLSAQLNAFSVSAEIKSRVYEALGIVEVPRRHSQQSQVATSR